MKTVIFMMTLAAAFVIQGETIQTLSKPTDFNLPQHITLEEDGSLLIKKNGWFIAQTSFKVDADCTYKISFEAKLPEGAATASIRYGLFAYDAANNDLGPQNVLYQADSETEIADPVQKGDTVIYIKNTAKWDHKSSISCIVYDVDPSGKLRDLPNFNILGNIKSIEVSGDKSKITLTTPARTDLAAGVMVRQHFSGWGFVGSLLAPLTADWKKFEFETKPGFSSKNTNLQWLHYTERGTAVLVTPGPTLIRNLTVEKSK